MKVLRFYQTSIFGIKRYKPSFSSWRKRRPPNNQERWRMQSHSKQKKHPWTIPATEMESQLSYQDVQLPSAKAVPGSIQLQTLNINSENILPSQITVQQLTAVSLNSDYKKCSWGVGTHLHQSPLNFSVSWGAFRETAATCSTPNSNHYFCLHITSCKKTITYPS